MPKIENWSKVDDEELPDDISVSWENDDNPQIIFIERMPIVPSLAERSPSQSVKHTVNITDEVTKKPDPLFRDTFEDWNEAKKKAVEWMRNHPNGSDDRREMIREERG